MSKSQFLIAASISLFSTIPSAHASTMADTIAAACPSCGAVSRTVVAPEIAHYAFDVPVGAGAYDVIRVHRVVRETAPEVIAATEDSLMMVHGDAWGFTSAFLASTSSPAVPDAHAMPIYLAQHGIDVWGLDFRWALVPAGVLDTSFMQGWGMGAHVSDVGTALGLATQVRSLSGADPSGPSEKMHLLGWSRGGQVAYSYLDEESQLPAAQRRVKGFIPVDIYTKTSNALWQTEACTRYAQSAAKVLAGSYADTNGTLLATLGQGALTNPNGLNAVYQTTNALAALEVGSITFAFMGAPPVPTYHHVGGTFLLPGVPTGLAYQSEAAWYGYLAGAAPFESIPLIADADAITCGTSQLGFDDHYGDITVPVFYVGAAGGFGASGLYSTSLLGSSDVTGIVRSAHPAWGDVADLGHVDIFNADHAEALFWQPILGWLQTR